MGRLFSLIVLVLLIPFSGKTWAEEAPASKRFDLSAGFRYSVPTGEEESGFKWSDFYDDGVGGSFEIGYRVTQHLTLHGGVSYDTFKGKAFLANTPLGVAVGKISDQSPLTLYLGMKTYFLAVATPQQASGVNPYLRFDIGATRFKAVDISGFQLGQSSTELSVGAGVGVDVLTMTNLILFMEAKYQNYGTPDQAGNSFKAIPLSFGLRYLI